MSSSAEIWARVRTVLESALEQDPLSRAGFLAAACGGDETLRAEVQVLLAGLDESPAFAEGAVAPVRARAAQSEDRLVGASIGPWKLLRRIGEGGTSSVYAAARADRQYTRIVALKVVRSGIDHEEILRRFRNERQILGALDHPNITRLLDGDITPDGLPYLVMEYVEGLSITQYCESRKLSVAERLRLFSTVCSAVQYAHSNLVIHRDLKPANILITAEGVPKLLDFGIAKLLRPEYSSDGPHLTRTQMRMMTPEYASPEQVSGDPITTMSDIYSLGVVLYEVLTTVRPYHFKTWTAGEIEQAIATQEPERPSLAAARLAKPAAGEETPEKLARRLRGDLDAIALKALRKEPNRRYATADALAEDIGRHLSGLPVGASRSTWRYRLGKFAARHRTGVSVSALCTVVLIAAAIVSLHFARVAILQRSLTVRIAEFAIGDLSSLPKSTEARKSELERFVADLNQFAAESPNDSTVRPLLFQAYLRAGDLQGSPYGNNVGDVDAADRDYRQAWALARQPWERAQASGRLGDVAMQRGDWQMALARSQEADPILQSALRDRPDQAQLWQEATRIRYRIGLVQSQLGKLDEAVASYRTELEYARNWAKRSPSSIAVQRALALAEEHLGGMLRQTKGAAAALPLLNSSLAKYQAFANANPEGALERWDIALVRESKAEALENLRRPSEAEENYRFSLRIIDRLIAEDPGNKQYIAARNSIWDPLAKLLHAEGKRPESRQLTELSLAALQPLVDKPDAAVSDMHQYCWDLLTTPFQDLHQSQEALRLARKLVGDRTDPSLLHLLALALEENGDLREAKETEEEALRLYQVSGPPPPGSKHAQSRTSSRACRNRYLAVRTLRSSKDPVSKKRTEPAMSGSVLGSGTVASSSKRVKLAAPPLVASKVIVVRSPTVTTGLKNSIFWCVALIPLSDTVFNAVLPEHDEPLKADPRHSRLSICTNPGNVGGSVNISSSYPWIIGGSSIVYASKY